MHDEQHPCGANKQKQNDHDVGSSLLLGATVEALRTCCSAFPITTKWCFDQDAKVLPGATLTKRTCNRCGSLQKRGDIVGTFQLALH